MRSAWLGLDPAQVWDCHAHLVGTGDSGSGIWLNPALESMIHPVQYAQRLFFLNAGCAHEAPGRVDQSYVERMQNLLEGMRPGAKLMLFAFDYFHREDGAISRDDSAFHVPNDYAAQRGAPASAPFRMGGFHPSLPQGLRRGADTGCGGRRPRR
ncbi:MAG: hypothetical protein M5R42_19025 [Rhodocyclaceae bacterium]|nr:hypothetical protein [Rhodocyclaceae bacterium]